MRLFTKLGKGIEAIEPLHPVATYIAELLGLPYKLAHIRLRNFIYLSIVIWYFILTNTYFHSIGCRVNELLEKVGTGIRWQFIYINYENGHLVAAILIPAIFFFLFELVQRRAEWEYWGYGSLITVAMLFHLLLKVFGVIVVNINHSKYNDLFNMGAILVLGFGTGYKYLIQKETNRTAILDGKLRLTRNIFSSHFITNSIAFIQVSEENMSDNLARFGSLLKLFINKSSKEVYSLHDEIRFVNAYVEWQIQLTNEDKTRHLEIPSYRSWERVGQYKSYPIIPLITQIFIENSFKYARDNQSDYLVRIKAKIRDGWLIITTQNTINPQIETGNGIGIGEVKKLLDVYYADGNYALNEDRTSTYDGAINKDKFAKTPLYEVVLKIKLNPPKLQKLIKQIENEETKHYRLGRQPRP